MPSAASLRAPSSCRSGGGIVALLIAGLVALPVAVLLRSGAEAPSFALTDPYVVRVLVFTVFQAAASTVLSLAFALPVALALRRRRFPGRDFVLRLFAVPLGLPQLVAVLGIVSVYGRQGLLNDTLAAIGAPLLPPVFGLCGILLAHVFFNMPFAARLLLAALDTVPRESLRLAASLGFGRWDSFRHVEWPFLRRAIPAIALLVFMLCATSFTVVLTLGGGPHNSTLEVAIYQALRFDFDPATAAWLSFLQIALCGLLLVAAQRWAPDLPSAERLAQQAVAPAADTALGRGVDGTALSIGVAFVGLPIAMVVADGLRADLLSLLSESDVWRAAATSAAISIAAGGLATVAAAFIAAALARSRGACEVFLSLTGRLVLLVPPVIIAAGWFLLIRRHVDPAAASPAAVVALNAVMAMPFVLPALGPAFRTAYETHDRLSSSLGIRGLLRFRLIDWPVLRRHLSLAMLVAMLVSLGDFGAIAFFGDESFRTLPLLLYQRIGSYRVADAAGLALILLAACLVLSTMIDRTRPREDRR